MTAASLGVARSPAGGGDGGADRVPRAASALVRLAPLLLSLAAACSTSAGPDLTNLADGEPLSYSVLVTGGAFIEPGPASESAQPLRRTYRPGGPESEAFELAAVVDVLRRGRVFVRVEADRGSVEERRGTAGLGGGDQAGAAPSRAFLEAARRGGYDFLLVVEGLQDRPIEFRGVNGQWPVTLAVWLLAGLGLVIGDHTYESEATLSIALRDVQTGRSVYSQVLSGGPVDLSLIDRSDFLGLLQSIVVPPFWVGNDDNAVEEEVRTVSTRRLLVSLARQLKSAGVQAQVNRELPAVLQVRRAGDRLQVEIDSAESLSFARVRLGTRSQRSAEIEAFERELMLSVTESGDRYLYRASLPVPGDQPTLQLLVQTVAGRVASTTVLLTP